MASSDKDIFIRDGYLVLDNFYSPSECNELIKRGQELASQFDPEKNVSIFQTKDQSKTTDDYFLASGSNISCFFEKDAFNDQGKLKGDLFHSLNKIGHAMHELDPVFHRFTFAPQMISLMNSLGLNDHQIIQSMLIFKHAHIGGEVDVHQDSTFLYTEPESCVGFWVALEDATKENGCLWAAPGGHKTTLRQRFRRKEGGGTEMITLDETPYEMKGMIPLEVKQGTCIVLHGFLPHYSLPNTSGKSRQAYAVHAVSKSAFYPMDNWLWTGDMRRADALQS